MSLGQKYYKLLMDHGPQTLHGLLQLRADANDLSIVSKQVHVAARSSMESLIADGLVYLTFLKGQPVYSVNSDGESVSEFPVHVARFGHDLSPCSLSLSFDKFEVNEVRPMNTPKGCVQVRVYLSSVLKGGLKSKELDLPTSFTNFLSAHMQTWGKWMKSSVRNVEPGDFVEVYFYGDSSFQRFQSVSASALFYTKSLVESFVTSWDFISMLQAFAEFLKVRLEESFYTKLSREMGFSLDTVFSSAAKQAEFGQDWFQQERKKLEQKFCKSVKRKAEEIVHGEEIVAYLKRVNLESFLPVLVGFMEEHNPVRFSTSPMFSASASLSRDEVKSRVNLWK